jgi:hypothetical protein
MSRRAETTGEPSSYPRTAFPNAASQVAMLNYPMPDPCPYVA